MHRQGEGRHYICAGPSNRAQCRPDCRRVHMSLLCLRLIRPRVKRCRRRQCLLESSCHGRCSRGGNSRETAASLDYQSLFLFLSFFPPSLSLLLSISIYVSLYSISRLYLTAHYIIYLHAVINKQRGNRESTQEPRKVCATTKVSRPRVFV